MTFYDLYGNALAYCEDGEHIYLFSGEAVAYLYNDIVYGYNGRQFGCFENGWIRDLGGHCVFFTEDSYGSGPAKPAKRAKSAKCAKYARPTKCAKHARRAKAAKSCSWSNLSGIQFFYQ